MNLQESIRRILREEKEIPGYLRRRLYIADEYMDGLNADSLHDGWVMNQIDDFVRACMGAITRMIISKTSKNSDYVSEDGYMRMYDEIYGFLIKLGYQKRLFKFFYDVMMDRWSKSFDDKEDLNEEDISNKDNEEIPKYLKRRLNIVDEYIDNLNPDVIQYFNQREDYVVSTINTIITIILDGVNIITNNPADSNNEGGGITAYEYMVLRDKTLDHLKRLGYVRKLINFFDDTIINRDKENLMEEKGSYEDPEVDVPQYLKRRLYMVDELMEQLKTPRRINYICELLSFQFSNFDSLRGWYGKDIIDEITTKIVDSIREDLKKTKGVDLDSNRRYFNLYDKISQTLVDLGYKQKTIDFFTKTALECKNHNI